VLIRKIGISLTACVEGIIQLFTIFYLHRIFLIFLSNDCNGKVGEGLDIFLRKYRKFDTVVLKKYYDYSSISTSTERSRYS
jgi:hypothetical protein